jgi:hypothetical protein
MSDPALELEYWSYEHEGLLRALEVMIDEIVQSADGGHPANCSALNGLHKALVHHLAEVQGIMGDVSVMVCREMEKATAKMQAQQKRNEEPATVQ